MFNDDLDRVEWADFLCRRHPNRLKPEAYRVAGQSVLTTICTRSKEATLLLDAVRPELVAALPVSADIAGCELIAWCLMPDHLHILLRVQQYGGDILRFLHSYKTWTGRKMRLASLPRWERSFWDRHARSSDDIANLVSYVLNNPVRVGLCETWQQWPHAYYRWAEA
ncbi:MAG: hypothetical protein GX131_10090 [candidate division WS1 bacterium]|jgi:REP element-mobilizing transposase RayT|nr:hypothetical protein [candidate division WS1 bacterium]